MEQNVKKLSVVMTNLLVIFLVVAVASFFVAATFNVLNITIFIDFQAISRYTSIAFLLVLICMSFQKL